MASSLSFKLDFTDLATKIVKVNLFCQYIEWYFQMKTTEHLNENDLNEND